MWFVFAIQKAQRLHYHKHQRTPRVKGSMETEVTGWRVCWMMLRHWWMSALEIKTKHKPRRLVGSWTLFQKQSRSNLSQLDLSNLLFEAMRSRCSCEYTRSQDSFKTEMFKIVSQMSWTHWAWRQNVAVPELHMCGRENSPLCCSSSGFPPILWCGTFMSYQFESNQKISVLSFAWIWITYGPHKAVAEVSNHNEPIGRKSGIQLVRKSMDFTFNCFELQVNWATN